MLRGDKNKCSVCGGGIWYGEHYSGCPKGLHAKAKPSASGYGVFLWMDSLGRFGTRENNGYVVRAMDILSSPYKPEMAIKVFKNRAAAHKYADKLTDGTENLP